jgi:uncharacterized protein (DUF2384 family)
MAAIKKSYEAAVLDTVPANIRESEILNVLYSKDVNWRYVDAMKTYTNFNDDVLSEWLNVSVKTFREYKKPKTVFKDNVKEQVLLLLALLKHGVASFGSVKAFERWLNQENFFFDNRKPLLYMNTVTGIRHIDDRLTAMDHGDNI